MKKITILFLLATIFIAACDNQDKIEDGTLPTIPPTITSVPHMTSTPPPQLDIPEAADIDWDLVSHHAPAMRPEYVSDIDAWEDNNRYYIEANMEFNESAALINAAQRTRFLNDTGIDLNEIVFRLYLNTTSLGGRTTVYDVSIDGQTVEPVFSERDTVVTIPLSEPLSDGETVEISLKFNAIMERGFGGASYQRAHYIHDLLALPGWHPTLSVVEDGTWWVSNPVPAADPHFAETALFEIFLTHAENINVAVSGVSIEVIENSDGTVTEHIVTGPMRYHIILASPIMGKITEEVDGITVNVYYQPGQERGAESAMETGLASLTVFNERFGDYPYSELDVVETFTTAGGIEFPGLIVLSTNIWNAGSQTLEMVTVHEVAHQWWYGLVHNDQINHPWIDESLTSFSERIYLQHTYGENSQRVLDHVQLSRNGYNQFRGSAGTVEFPMNSPADVLSRYPGGYGFGIYTKGRVFYGELRELIGPEAFDKGLRSYFAENKYGIVNSGEIIQHMEAASGQELDAFFYEWVGDFEGLDPDVKTQIDSQSEREN